ncbi:hypothetical protein [Kitasatospora purpeofusca]|uniref:Uncharacterized protein n=1 Tax=Kitasatospora purpeofusca TaxID=67352 RepID=A0ABZ1U1F1_9ACTN|nr:hypothetical protein [Kitasatospora purpeofusca]
MPAPAPSSAFLGPLPAALPPHPSHRRTGRRLLAVAVLGLAVPLVLGPAAIALPSAPAGAVGAVPVPVAAPDSSEQPGAPAPSGSAAPSDGLSPVASPDPEQEPKPDPDPEEPSAGTEPEPGAVAETPAGPTASEPSPAEPASPAPAASVSPSWVVPAATAVAWQAVGRVRPGPSWADREERHGRHRPASAPERTGSAPEGAPDRGRAQAAEQAPEQPVGAGADAAPGPAAGGADGAVEPAAPDDGSGGETLALGRPGPEAVLVGPALLPTRWDDAATRQLPLGAGLGLIGCGLGLIGLRLRRH